MKKDFDLYRIVTILAMITMPAAAAINFGDAAYDALLVRTLPQLAVFAGICTGIGFETIGIVAGHRAISYHGKGDPRWKMAAAALVAYMAIGVWEMIDIPFARFVPLLSGLVYVLAGMQKEAESERETAVADKDYGRKLELFKLKQEHELKLKEAELDATKKIEQAKARAAAKTARSPRQEARQDDGNLPGDWRQLTRQQKRDLAHATREQREEMMPEMAARTRREWHKRADKIAAQNGQYQV